MKKESFRNSNAQESSEKESYLDFKKLALRIPEDPAHVSTSYAERQDLTMRMRRFTNLTNAFSKKVENLAHSVSLHFMYYNFARIHKTLRVTPAMEAGVTNHVWSLEEIAGLAY